ncbi:phage antirepressor KilAC domain-containing protein [Companilactobacillus nantensis]|uniref:Phage antirepressor protein n=1 Tax=Companilactobacillus nantensis DSM 16982 TaxID=1423774 RepID=A0A0R1WLS7_9LACO|nr:phage antirepressor KilAC domain-containing protein [Companilactobacillus nantensis]KRM18445.1 phage antirepressor protein [Companilactobacillus nantensis DSM 16982]GEO63015.1 antirepressor [Companilactobacillus nantensis]
MNNLRSFSFAGIDIRTSVIDGEPYFVAKDVADVLGYSETNALTKRLDDEDFISAKLSGMNMKSILINESGLYTSIIGSKLPNTKPFKYWITHEVLPSIRKNGVYMTNQKAYDITHNPGALGDLLLQAGEQLKIKDAQISELTPKAQFADQISKSNDTILVRDLAKLLYKNGIAIGQKELFRWLVEKNYLIRKSNGYIPTQRAVALKVMEVRETPILHQYTQPTISFTTLVTTKGQQYFINKFLSANRKVEA